MKKNLVFRFLYLAGFPRLFRFIKGDAVTILNLHRVSEDRDYFFEPLSPANFEKLVKYSLEHYSILSFSDLLDVKRQLKKPPLIFSFDDGYYDFYEIALPILRKYKVPSNHNIVNDCANSGRAIWTHRLNEVFNHCRSNAIDLKFQFNSGTLRCRDLHGSWMSFYLAVFKTLLSMPKSVREKIITQNEQQLSISPGCRMMNWDQIIECSRNKVEIGSHTYSHDVITSVDEEQTLQHELLDSKSEIEAVLNKEVRVIALPNGQGDERINGAAQRAGYRFLLYVNDGVSRFQEGDKFHVLNRINIVRESYFEMILRAEMFHSVMRKYV
jgi:peptidoglycan/xylan/chitin deacetylase (PgdA/CDA1 family)